MDVKGTAVKSIEEFVKNRFKVDYNKWLTSLPDKSRKIFFEGVISNRWYSIEDAAIIPTEKIAELFYNKDNKKGAWECGKYSANISLKGIYMIYVKLSKPTHLIERASRIFAAYYSDSVMSTRNYEKYSVDVVIEKFAVPSSVIEYRVGGWIETALEITGCRDIKIHIAQSLTRGDKETVFNISWKI
jgi:hypothetical protein